MTTTEIISKVTELIRIVKLNDVTVLIDYNSLLTQFKNKSDGYLTFLLISLKSNALLSSLYLIEYYDIEESEVLNDKNFNNIDRKLISNVFRSSKIKKIKKLI